MTTASATKPWVTYPRPNPRANLRLFCFPHAGGSASFFRTWPDSLPANLEVCPIQYPGRENRMFEPPFTRLAPLVEALTPHILATTPRPFAFFGHSMGAMISFELTRRLRQLNAAQPVALFVSGCPAPQVEDREPPIHKLEGAEFIKAVGDYNGIPQEVLDHKELLELMLPILRADFTLVETYSYTPEAPLDLPIMAFGGIQDTHVPRERIQAWREQTRGSFALRMFPGDHFFLQPARHLLTQAIAQDLARLHKALR